MTPGKSLTDLGSSFLFRGVDREAVMQHVNGFRTEHRSARTRLFVQGDAARSVHILAEGRIKTTRLTTSGRDVALAILGPDEILGEDVLLGDTTVRTTTATCLSDSLVHTLSAEAFRRLCLSHPVIATNVARRCVAKHGATQDAIEDLCGAHVSTRIARLLDRLALDYGVTSEHGTRIDVRLTHDEVAALIGSTRETVSLELNNFVRSGRLRFQQRHFVLTQCLSPS